MVTKSNNSRKDDLRYFIPIEKIPRNKTELKSKCERTRCLFISTCFLMKPTYTILFRSCVSPKRIYIIIITFSRRRIPFLAITLAFYCLDAHKCYFCYFSSALCSDYNDYYYILQPLSFVVPFKNLYNSNKREK